jgi:MPBQ/MSBQ methyltransferase
MMKTLFKEKKSVENHPQQETSCITKSSKNTFSKYREVIEYYEIAGNDYAEWSRNFNMHFGYFKWGMNPFRLEPMLNQMNEQVLKALRVSENNASENNTIQMLDLGCGLGTVARYIACKNPNYTITGLTVVPWQVKISNQMTQEQNLDHQVKIILADYTQIPFETQSVDYAYAIESSCYAEGQSKEALVQEAGRVLKSGGKWVVADFFLKHANPLPRLVQKIADKTCQCWALPCFAELTAFRKAMEKSGFQNIEIREISWNVAPSVAYIPQTVLTFLGKEWWKNKSLKLAPERWNNTLAPIFGLMLGLHRRHFGYYIISAEKV